MEIDVNPRKIFYRLLFGIIVLLILNIVIMFINIKFGHYRTMNILDFDHEANIPTLYSTFLLFICSTLLFLISKTRKSSGSPYVLWKILGFIFLFLAVDEITMLHERIHAPLQRVFGSSGIMFFAWLIPYALAVIVLGVLYLRFLMSLPKKTALLFILSGGIFVLGAIGFEMLGGLESKAHGFDTLRYYILYNFEEVFEMLGVTIFIYSLLSYYKNLNNVITINIKN